MQNDALEQESAPVTREHVQDVIDAHVLPYVRNHGGGLVITDVADDGSVTCRLDGACRSCPSAPITVVAVIERALHTHISPHIKVHVPQIGVSSAALERIRRFYPARVTGSKRRAS
jgi:Fe-S cluster biogenesis protein NfuA